MSIDFAAASGRSQVGDIYQSNLIGVRYKALVAQNPYMSERPDALLALASSGLPTHVLASQGDALYGMQAADSIRQQLEGMSESAQRTLFNSLTPAQQQSLGQQGYKMPQREEDSWYSGILRQAGNTMGAAMNVVGSTAEFLHVGDALDAMTWLADQPMHMYRAIRMMDFDEQMAALAGAALAVGAIAATPFTAGGSLAALGALGMAGLAGGTLAANTSAAITGGTQWWDAWSTSWDGEKTFDRAAQAHADEILGDPRLTGLAKDIAFEMPQGYTVNQLARDVAGTREQDTKTHVETLRKVAERYAEPNTAEFDKMMQGMYAMLQSDPFQRAVQTLQNGKISLGRDSADFLSDLTFDSFGPGDFGYNMLSGSIDAAFQLALDPFLIGGKVAEGAAFLRRGMPILEGPEAAERFLAISRSDKGVARLHEAVAEAVYNKDFNAMMRYGGAFKENTLDLWAYRDMLQKQALEANKEFKFGAEELRQWVVTKQRLKPLMEGYGTVRGFGEGRMLDTLTLRKKGVLKVTEGLRAFTGGLTDKTMIDNLVDILHKTNDPNVVASLLPETVFPDLIDNIAGKKLDDLTHIIHSTDDEWAQLSDAEKLVHEQTAAQMGFASPRDVLEPNYSAAKAEYTKYQLERGKAITDDHLYQAAADMAPNEFVRSMREFGHTMGFPRIKGHSPGNMVGNFLTRMTTMVPGKAIPLSGDSAAKAIKDMTELGGLVGIPDFMRREWANAIVYMPTPGMRMHAVQSYVDTMFTAAGAKLLPGGQELVDEYLRRVFHAYSGGGMDALMVNGKLSKRALFLSETADAIVVPDVTELRRAVRQGVIGKLIGVADAEVLQAFQNKIWKPSVLLRIGFIPRAAGEEMLNFMLRAGMGSLGQETMARSIVRAEEWERINAAKLAGQTLKAEEELLWAKGKHMVSQRWLSRMFDRYDWQDPALNKLERAIGFIGEKAYTPVLERVESGVRSVAKEGAFNWDRRAQGALDRIADTHVPLTGGTNRDHMLASMRNEVDDVRKFDLARTFDSLIFGTKFSWRRMIAGGVDNELVNASRHFNETFARAILGEVGASTMGPFDPGLDHQGRMRYKLREGNDSGSYVEYVNIRGHRTRLDNQDPLYVNAMHHEMTRLVDDPVTRAVVTRRISRIKPSTIDVDELMPVVQHYLTHTALGDKGGVQLFNAFLGAPDHRHFSALLDSMEYGPYGDLASHLRATVPSHKFSYERVRESLNEYAHGIRTRKQLMIHGNVVDAFDQLERVQDYLSGLSYADRRWAGAYLSHAEMDDVATWQRLNAIGDAHTQAARNAEFAAVVDRDNPATWSPELLERLQEDAANVRYQLSANKGPKVKDWMQAEAYQMTPDEVYTYLTSNQRTLGVWDDHWDSIDQSTDLIHPVGPEIPEAPTRTLFYDSIDHARQDMTSDLINAMNDPHVQGELAHVQGLHISKAELSRQFERSLQHDGFVTAWHPQVNDDELRKIDFSFDQLVMRTSDRDYVTRNKAAVEAWLAERKRGAQALMGDRKLADEITRALGDGADAAFAADVPRSIIDGHMANGFWPAHKDGANPTVWGADPNLPLGLRHPATQKPLDQDVNDLADAIAERVRQVWTKGNREAWIPLQRTLEDGSVEARVYRRINGEYVPLKLDERTYGRDVYYDQNGKEIEWADDRYWRSEMERGDGEIMWEAVGPMLEDAADEMRRGLAFSSRSVPLRVGEMEPINVNKKVRVYRSNVSHVTEVGAGLPNVTLANDWRVAKDMSHWDRFVRYGFDRVLGPAIDAMARRPMAFHFFAERYAHNMAMTGWLRDPELVGHMRNLVTKLTEGDLGEANQVAGYLRTVMPHVEGDAAETLVGLRNTEVLAWPRGHTPQDWARRLDDAKVNIDFELATGKMTAAEHKVTDLAISRLKSRSYDELVSIIAPEATAMEFVKHADTVMGGVERVIGPGQDGAGVFVRTVDGGRAFIPNKHLGRLTHDDWDLVRAMKSNLANIQREAGDAAAVAAVNDMLPFIDSHELKTQFAEFGKGFLPFWYAEENFLKRWGRTLAHAPVTTIRKAQLTYMGLKSAGVVRTDENGRDWFVYPGSGLLMDVLQKLPGMADLPLDVAFQSPTDMMLPGVNSRFGTPQFGPLVSVPLQLMTHAVPELQNDFNRKVLGDLGASKGVLEQLIPSALANTWKAVTMDSDSQDTRYVSAQMAAIAHLEANGQGLPANADAAQQQEFLDKVRNHARIILFAQALGGWFAPGPVSPVIADSQTQAITGLNVTVESEKLASEYQVLVREFGIEQGTVKYLELYPQNDISNLVNPLAYTVAKNESVSGAPLPSTEYSLKFYDENKNFMEAYPMATPWLLPNDPSIDNKHSQYAYDQQTANGLRQRRSPLEFLGQIKFKEASSLYFEQREAWQTRVEAARTAKRDDIVREENARWNQWSQTYKAAHPLFTELLEGGAARERRSKVIDQMRVVINDPLVPQSAQVEPMRRMMADFDYYLMRKAELSLDRSAKGRLAVENFKGLYEQHMTDLAKKYPVLESFWNGVLRPESALD